MEIRHLKLIKIIAEEGTITRAIEKLHLTQSALSHQLRDAEHLLGTKIFVRGKKNMTLTRAGEKLYATANEILSKLDATQSEIKNLVFGESGEIKLSAECYSSYHWLPSVMKEFNFVYPKVDLQLVVNATHYPLQKLLKGEIDLAITSDPIKNDRIEFVELFTDEMVAVVSRAHEWTEKKYVRAEDFVKETLIIHSLPMETVTVHQFFLKPAKVAPKKVTPLPLTEAAIEMVRADMGVMVMARWSAKKFITDDSLQTVKVGKAGLHRKHYLAYIKSKSHPEFFHRFIDFLQKEISF
jgi:LysR family transcriptional regulator, regulator for metE and metH